MAVPIIITGQKVEAIIDCGASGPVVGRAIGSCLGVWKRARKISIRQANKSKLKEGHYIINNTIIIPEAKSVNHPAIVKAGTVNRKAESVINKFSLDVEVFDIGQKEVVLELSWLKENGFSVDVSNSHLILSTTVIPCTVKNLPSIQLISMDELNELELEEGEILLIFDAKDRYVKYAKVFSAEFTARLPKHHQWDHKIPLTENAKPPGGRVIYKTTWEEKEVLAEYLKEHMPSGKVCRSRSSASSPILFTRKANRKLQLCMDYRGLNNVTLKNKYPLTRIDKLLKKTQGLKFFTKLDLKNGYYLIRIADSDEWKTAF